MVLTSDDDTVIVDLRINQDPSYGGSQSKMKAPYQGFFFFEWEMSDSRLFTSFLFKVIGIGKKD